MFLDITSRCERPCADCQPGRDDGGDLDLDMLRALLPALRALGFSTLGLMGGEPIFHPRFDELLDLVCHGGYRLGLRSHGWRASEYLDKLAPFRERIAYVVLTLRAHTAREHDNASPVAGGFARIVDAIDAYRAADHAVVVDHIVNQQTVNDLVAMGEFLADRLITLNLRAPVGPDTDAAWHLRPDVQSILIPRIHALKSILNERIILEPSLGFNKTYDFCSNLGLMDKVMLRANGDIVFCRVCRRDDRSAILGNIGNEELSIILGRHPGRVGAIWSARLATIATERPAISNNCTFCQETLRATAAT